MKRILFVMCITGLLFGCASVVIPSDKLLNVEPGMTKEEILETFGTPYGTNFINNYYILTYHWHDGYRSAIKYHFILDSTDKLISWQEAAENNNQVNVNGVLIHLPL